MSEDDHARERESFKEIVASVDKSIRDHRTFVDGWLYNGGTVLTLSLTAAVSLVSGKVFPEGIISDWVAPVLSTTAGLVVALERSLGFGQRWRFHTEMRAGYITVKDMINMYFSYPQEEKEQRAKAKAEIWQSLNALRSRESAIPNSGGAVTGGA